LNGDYSNNQLTISAQVKIDNLNSDRMVWKWLKPSEDIDKRVGVNLDINNSGKMSFLVEIVCILKIQQLYHIIYSFSSDELAAIANIEYGLTYNQILYYLPLI
jgi:hypothetical protein